MLKGIDVSEHQGVIDWTKVKGNVDFAMLRAGYGQNNIDKQFVRNIKECNRLGIPVGIYWFSYALNESMARQEAKYALAAVKDYTLEYPIAFDFEYDTVRYAKQNGVNVSKIFATDLVKAFCLAIEGANYYAMNYTNQDFLLNMFYFDEIKRFCPWYAWYNSKLNRTDVGMWQYTESGKMSGISGSSVDMNYAYVDFAKDIRDRGLNNIKPSKPTDDDKEIKRYAENGVCTITTASGLNIRAAASTESEIVGKYNKGEKVTYDLVVITEKYTWLSWIGGSGKRRYMAYKDRKTGEKWGVCE
ncbi:MAG: GH25 family lysozyme [Clostridia bacterium]